MYRVYHIIIQNKNPFAIKIPRTSASAEIQGLGENDYLTTLSMPLVLDMCCGCCEAVRIGIYIDAVTRL